MGNSVSNNFNEEDHNTLRDKLIRASGIPLSEPTSAFPLICGEEAKKNNTGPWYQSLGEEAEGRLPSDYTKEEREIAGLNSSDKLKTNMFKIGDKLVVKVSVRHTDYENLKQWENCEGVVSHINLIDGNTKYPYYEYLMQTVSGSDCKYLKFDEDCLKLACYHSEVEEIKHKKYSKDESGEVKELATPKTEEIFIGGDPISKERFKQEYMGEFINVDQELGTKNNPLVAGPCPISKGPKLVPLNLPCTASIGKTIEDHNTLANCQDDPRSQLAMVWDKINTLEKENKLLNEVIKAKNTELEELNITINRLRVWIGK